MPRAIRSRSNSTCAACAVRRLSIYPGHTRDAHESVGARRGRSRPAAGRGAARAATPLGASLIAGLPRRLGLYGTGATIDGRCGATSAGEAAPTLADMVRARKRPRRRARARRGKPTADAADALADYGTPGAGRRVVGED